MSPSAVLCCVAPLSLLVQNGRRRRAKSVFMGKNTSPANNGSREQMGSTTAKWALIYIGLYTYQARP